MGHIEKIICMCPAINTLGVWNDSDGEICEPVLLWAAIEDNQGDQYIVGITRSDIGNITACEFDNNFIGYRDKVKA